MTWHPPVQVEPIRHNGEMVHAGVPCQNVGGFSSHLHLCQLSGNHATHRCYCKATWDDAWGQPIAEWRSNAKPHLKERRSK